MNLEQLTKKVNESVLKAGAFIREQSLKIKEIEIEEKDRNSLVSYVDKNAETMLVEDFQQLIPGSGFITEEATIKSEEKEWVWIIDPLDGTTNFLWGVPVYSVSVGLLHNKELVAGWVYEINRDELFCGWKGGGAWMNGKRISVSDKPTLEKSLMATGFPYTDYSGIDAYMTTLKDLMEKSRGVRRMGSAAVDLAYVACGRFEGFFEYGLNPWDVAGGILLIQEAGGRVTDFNGGNDALFGRQILATNELIADELQGLVKGNFGL
jgi:myo-inositol-1(or 4)-monophosphatase